VTREERVALAEHRGIAPEVAEIGSAVVMRFPQGPDSPMPNRAVGRG
jgi:hypothetical protein